MDCRQRKTRKNSSINYRRYNYEQFPNHVFAPLLYFAPAGAAVDVLVCVYAATVATGSAPVLQVLLLILRRATAGRRGTLQAHYCQGYKLVVYTYRTNVLGASAVWRLTV